MKRLSNTVRLLCLGLALTLSSGASADTTYYPLDETSTAEFLDYCRANGGTLLIDANSDLEGDCEATLQYYDGGAEGAPAAPPGDSASLSTYEKFSRFAAQTVRELWVGKEAHAEIFGRRRQEPPPPQPVGNGACPPGYHWGRIALLPLNNPPYGCIPDPGQPGTITNNGTSVTIHVNR